MTDAGLILLLEEEWRRILPKAPEQPWGELIAQHPKLRPEHWLRILQQIRTTGVQIRVSSSAYLETCIFQKEDQLKQIRIGPIMDVEDEL